MFVIAQKYHTKHPGKNLQNYSAKIGYYIENGVDMETTYPLNSNVSDLNMLENM